MHWLRRSPDYIIVPHRSRSEALERACAHPRPNQAARVVVIIDIRPRSDLGYLSRSPPRQPPGFIYGGITDYRRTLLVHGATRACSVILAIVGKLCAVTPERGMRPFGEIAAVSLIAQSDLWCD
jgi:hypothetical protein